MKLNNRDWFPSRFFNVLLFSITFFVSSVSTLESLNSKQYASFVNFFKFELLGVMDGIKGNTDANLWLFGRKIF